MSNTREVVVVAGARGNLGVLVCEALLARAKREGKPLLVRGVVRRGRAPVAQPLDDGTTAQLRIEEVDYESEGDLRRVCAGASCVVSTLQGLEDVIIGAQARLLSAALHSGVRRFIPSDFSGDFTRLPEGSHRNLDLRRRFHVRADELIAASKSNLQFTSIFQGGFTELLGSGWVLFDYKKRRVTYFGEPDAPMEYTTWKNTAEFTAAVALDPAPTPRQLFIAGRQLSPRQAQQLARELTGADFKLQRVMPVWLLRLVIGLMKRVKPGKPGEVMPLWVAMQYGYCGALGVMSPPKLDNDRYAGIEWVGPEATIRAAFAAAEGGTR